MQKRVDLLADSGLPAVPSDGNLVFHRGEGVAPRVVPMMHLVLADHWLRHKLQVE